MNEQIKALTMRELEKLGAVEVVFHALGAETVDGDTSLTPFDVSRFKEGSFFLAVTALTGTNIIVTIKTKDPGSANWSTITTFTTATGATAEAKHVAANLGSKIAAFWDMTATTVTFSIYAVLKTK